MPEKSTRINSIGEHGPETPIRSVSAGLIPNEFEHIRIGNMYNIYNTGIVLNKHADCGAGSRFYRIVQPNVIRLLILIIINILQITKGLSCLLRSFVV